MHRVYKSVVVTVPGLKVKGDDTSEKMSGMITEISNREAEKGWKLKQVTLALVRDGALQKVILTLEK